jgi:hypothetical protein
MSGHVADACWAGKYDSIAAEYPNITTLTFVRDPGKPTERIVGSSLYIKTTNTQTGEPTIVLRGINPIENYINKVKVDDFWSSYLSYVRQITPESTPIAVVIDGKSGAGTSNRPVISDFLTATVKPTTDGVPLELAEDSTFNGYVLSRQREEPAYRVT